MSRLSHGILHGISNVTSLVLVSLSFLLPGSLLLAAFNVRNLIQEMDKRFEVIAYLKDGLAEGERDDLSRRIAAIPGVESVRYISPQDALAALKQEMGEEASALRGLDRNPLPGALHVTPTRSFRTPEGISEIALKLKNDPGVEQVESGEDWVTTFYQAKTVSWNAILGVLGSSTFLVLLILGYSARLSYWRDRPGKKIRSTRPRPLWRVWFGAFSGVELRSFFSGVAFASSHSPCSRSRSSRPRSWRLLWVEEHSWA